MHLRISVLVVGDSHLHGNTACSFLSSKKKYFYNYNSNTFIVQIIIVNETKLILGNKRQCSGKLI